MLSWELAYRFRKSTSHSGFLSFIAASSTIGIVLGCAVLIAALSMMNGFQGALQDKLLKVVPHIQYQKVDGSFQNWQQIARIAEQDAAVTQVRPVIRQTVMVQSGNAFKGVALQGIEPTADNGAISEFIDSKALQQLGKKPNSIVLGEGLAKDIGVTVGDRLTVLVAERSNKAFQAPTRRTLNVVGLFRFGGEIDHQNAYVDLSTARGLIGLDSGVTGIQLSVADVFAADEVAQRVGNQLPELVYVQHWMRTHGHLYRDIELVRTVIYLVLILVMAVACFNIVSTLVLTVTKKQPQIAMLKTMGLGDRQIILCFIWQGLQNGLWGTFWGILSGIGLSLVLPDMVWWLEQAFSLQLLSDDIYFVSEIPSQIRWQDVTLVATVAVVMSLLATFYPAWRATKVQPAQALHGNH